MLSRLSQYSHFVIVHTPFPTFSCGGIPGSRPGAMLLLARLATLPGYWGDVPRCGFSSILTGSKAFPLYHYHRSKSSRPSYIGSNPPPHSTVPPGVREDLPAPPVCSANSSTNSRAYCVTPLSHALRCFSAAILSRNFSMFIVIPLFKSGAAVV